MRHEVIENLYDIIDEMTLLLVEHANMGYLDALCAIGENIVNADVLQEVEMEIEIKLFQLGKRLNEVEFDVEEVRKALQLALLKGLKADYIALDALTPDSIALLVGHLIVKLNKHVQNLSIADFTVGTGNLLTAVLNTLGEVPKEIYGVDVDYKMLEVSKMMANMQDYDVSFHHQSSARRMAVPKVDIIIGDLPSSGNADAADLDSQLAQKGCNYLPYLLIENHLNYLNEDGYAIYVINNNFFSQNFAPDLHNILTDKAEIGMLLQLPEGLFKEKINQKSILVLKKPGKEFTKVKEVLVGNFPEFGNIEGFRTMLTKIENWVIINRWARN